MNKDLDWDNIGRYLDAYDMHAGDEGMQNGFAFAMLKECYPEEESYDTAKRRFFATEGKSTQDVYAYFRKLYDDYKGDFGNGEVKRYADNPESFTPEQENELLRKYPYQAFLKVTRNLPQNVRDTAFGIVFAEGNRSNVSEAFADKLLAMPENERNAALWGAYVLSPETSSNFFKRVVNRLLENLGDNAFNISSYWEQSQKGVNPNTIYDAVTKLDAIGENGKIKPEKLAALNKKLNELRGENSIFNEESSQVYGEKFGNLFSGKGYKADDKEYTADFIEAEYKKGKQAKETFKLVSQLREIMRTRYEKQNIVKQTFEDATVVGVEMLKYVGAAAVGTLISKNPWASASLVGAVMYSEFKPQMFNALRHEGNMSVENANKYANYATMGMIAANYIGYTRWLKAVKPSSYLLGTEITKANARDYLFHAIAEMPKTFLREGVAETASEYMESVVEYATKSWVADHEGATFDQRQLFDNFCQDFLDTTRIMPTLMFGSTLLGGGLAVNKIRRDSGIGWNLRQFVSPSEAVNHQVQAQAAMAQADAAVLKAGESLGDKSTAYDFVRKYRDAKTDEERENLFTEKFPNEEERANAKAALENVDKLNDEVNRTFAQMLADAAKQNADETERLDRENQAIDGVLDEAENSQKGSPKFKIVEELLDRLDARDSVVEINSAADLESMGYSAEMAQSIMDSMGRKGFFSAEDGKIYMLPAHFENGVDAFRTFVHERGHLIAQKIKDTPEYAGMLQRIVDITGGKEVLRSLLPSGYANDDVSVAAEEYLMRVVERVAMEDVLNANQKGVWNFLKTKLKKWFGGDRTLATMADRELAEMARFIYRQATTPQPIQHPNHWEAFTPENNGKKVSGVWQVVDADEIITSTDNGYDDALQPRNRRRKGSDIQTAEIATNLNPALLGASAKTSDGAPIVDARGMVISGNGRTLAIRKAYEAERPERAQAYKNFVLEQAERLGLDVPANFNKPMLVRRVDDLVGMSMEEFAAKSNKSDLAGMSNAENAIADARRILDAHLLDRFFPSDNGDVLAASNNDFITEFLNIIGGREEYIDKNGARKPNLAPRIKAAVLAAMLNPEKRDIIENLLDNPQGWSGLINGLFGAVANLAKLDGNVDYNLADELSRAVEIFVGFQRAGESVATFNAQGDMFNEPISDEVGFLIELFEKNTRTPTGISGVLNAYYNLVKNIDTTTQDMFGEENPSKIDELRAAYQKYSTSLTEEPNVSWRDTGEPTEAEIAEARRQKADVKAKWTNPDGSMKKGYMKAPNGKPSKLTEEQWLQVRTPNFKRWFGDWEKSAYANAAMDFLENTAPVKELSGQEFQKDGVKLTEKVPAFFDSINNVAHNEELGDVVLDLKGVEDSIAHGVGRLKAAAFMAVPEVIEKGFIFSREKNWKNRNWDSAVLVAPVKIGTEDYVCEVVVKRDSKKSAFYLHEVEIKKTLEGVFKSVANNGYASQVSRLIIGKHIAEVKGNVSKVVDENGEPLVVYHNTPNKFTIFKPSERGRFGRGIYATSNPEDTSYSKKWNMMALFANARKLRNPMEKVPVEFLRKLQKQAEEYLLENPPELFVGKKEAMLDFYFGKNRNEIFQHSFGSFYWNNLRDILDQVNKVFGSDFNIEADGFIIERDGGKWFNFFDRSQVKSATDNVGTYSNNPDIRWRDVEETPNLFERLKGVQGESTTEEKLKETGDLKYYFDYFKKNLLGKEIQTPIGKFAHFNLGHFNKLIARGENKGESEAVSSLKEWTDKIENHGVDLGKNPPKGFDYARACNMPLVVDVLQNPQFVLVDTDDTLLFVKKYGEKTYFWCSVMNNGETLGIKSWRPLRLTKRKCEQLKVVYTKENGVVNLAQPRESQRELDSTNLSENQEKNSRLRFLLRQERSENPDIRWKDDTVLMPIDINVLVARNIDALMNAIRKSHTSVLAKKAELDKKYPDDDKDSRHGKITELRDFILDNFSSELVPIAKLSDKDFKFYRKQFGIRDRFVYTSFGYAIEHYFNRHPDTPIENYLLLPDTIINPDKKKEVGKWIKDELGEWIYDASQAFVKEYDKWHVSTIKVDTQLTQSGKKLIAFKNFYGARKEPYGNKKTIEDYWKNATSSSKVIRRQAKISTLNNFNRQGESSTDGIENQEKNSRLRFLLRQERTENPVIWASIVLAKEILNGRGITRAKVEKLLPTEQFDGSKQNYAVERAQRIAEKTKATQKQFSKDLDIAIRKAESNLYWQDEFVENAYRAFSKGGEEYGFAKQRLMQYLKDLRNKELNKVKGYETDDFDVDLVDAILKAQEAEPERAAGEESKTAGEEAEEELEESGGAFEGDEELSGKKIPLAPSKIRDVIGAIRREVVKRVRNSDGDQKTLDEKYRKTLVNVLTDAMKELVYGKEREDIGKKIEELKTVKHAVITVKDGERVGQKIDNFTLRAENIALRIFRRGVRDSKKLMTEKLDAILARRGKKPSRMQRDDKRSMTGLVQQRIYNISRYVEMDAEALEDVRREAIAKLEDVDKNFVQDAEKGKIREDVEDVRAEVENVLHDIEMFGGWDDKSRAEMAQALEFLEKTIDTETAAQRERVEKRKERNAKVRKIISDALKMSEHNAARDGGMRVAIRKVLNGSLPLDSFLGLLGESATGETRKLFEEWRKDFVARVDRAANAKANEVFQTQQKFIKLVEDSYSMDFHDAIKRLLEKKGEYEKFSKPVDGMRQPMSLANVIQLYVSAAQKNYERNFYEHRAVRSPEYKKLQDEIDEIQSKFPERADKTGAEWEDAKARIDELEKKQAQMREEALADYLKSIEVVLSDGDRRFIEGLRQLYKDALPSISAVAKRVIGLPIEQADALYMPVKVKRSGNLGEGVPQVPVVPKSLSQRVPHLRDLDETADPISLFTDRISENAQFKHFSELYIEMRGIFGDGDLQDLIRQRCGADVLTGLKEFIADIATGKTRGPQNELLRKTNGLTAVMLLGFNLGSGVRQVLPGVASFAPAIGGWNVFKNMMSFFTPEGFAAAREICRSDTGRRRFEIGNMQIMEELLSTPDQNRFWAAYKRHALFFNRFADKLSIMFIGQGIYRSGVEEYLRRGFSEAEAKKLAMADMWQIAERTQASGRIHNMSHWQRRGGEYGKALGLFSSPPQLMFSMAYAKCRRALALGVKTPEGRAAVWDALSTLFYVSVCVEGSYALSGVLWNALLKGFFDDDDGEQILKQMALGPFGGLFIFGRIIEGAGSNYGTSLAPIEQLSRPIRNTKNLLFDAGQFDAEKALEDLDKLAKSLFPLYRDGRKLYERFAN